MSGCGGGGTTNSTTTPTDPTQFVPPAEPRPLNGPVTALLSAPDGSGDIYVAGTFTTYGGQPVRPLIRVRPDGSVNPTFNLTQSIRPFTDATNRITCLAVADDGSTDIYVAEVFDVPPDSQNNPQAGRIWRVRANGTVNPSFMMGELTHTLSVSPFRLNTIAPVGDHSGSLYIGGIFDQYNKAPVPSLIRVTSSGTRDSSFPQLANVFSSEGVLLVIPLNDGSGNVYVVNDVPVDCCPDIEGLSIRRLHFDGSLDPTFNDGPGAASGALIAPAIYTVIMANDSTGDLLVGGHFITFGGDLNPNGPNAVIDLARVNPDGTLDRQTPTPILSPGVNVTVLAVTGDGSGALLVGRGGQLTRYTRTAVVDGTFQVGLAQGGTRGITALLPTADGTGDVYVGGDFTSYNGFAGALVRVKKDGTLY